jgi:hypothetical protein
MSFATCESPVRKVAFIDIENLCGTSSPTQLECEEVRVFCTERIGLDRTMVVGACSHYAARHASFAWPTARWLWRSGRDGADTALLDEIRDLRNSQRFSHVIIGSGDGIFAEVVTELAAGNTRVTVVSRRRSLSRSLVRSAAELIVYEDLPFNSELDAPSSNLAALPKTLRSHTRTTTICGH